MRSQLSRRAAVILPAVISIGIVRMAFRNVAISPIPCSFFCSRLDHQARAKVHVGLEPGAFLLAVMLIGVIGCSLATIWKEDYRMGRCRLLAFRC